VLQAASAMQISPTLRTGSHAPLGEHHRPSGHPVSAQVRSHEVASAQRPVAQRTEGGVMHVPVASHMPAGYKRPAVQRGIPQGVPAGRGDQSVAFRVGSQIWHG
jgi:hypothetical protein